MTNIINISNTITSYYAISKPLTKEMQLNELTKLFIKKKIPTDILQYNLAPYLSTQRGIKEIKSVKVSPRQPLFELKNWLSEHLPNKVAVFARRTLVTVMFLWDLLKYAMLAIIGFPIGLVYVVIAFLLYVFVRCITCDESKFQADYYIECSCCPSTRYDSIVNPDTCCCFNFNPNRFNRSCLYDFLNCCCVLTSTPDLERGTHPNNIRDTSAHFKDVDFHFIPPPIDNSSTWLSFTGFSRFANQVNVKPKTMARFHGEEGILI